LSVGCPGSRAAAGKNGTDGSAGAVGPTGIRGFEGKPGMQERTAVDVAVLFAEEIARGVPVVTGAVTGGAP
jgi:hypothetical protein